MRDDFSKLKQYIDNSNKTVAVTGAGISYLYGMRRLKQSVGRLSAGRIFSASYVRKNPDVVCTFDCESTDNDYNYKEFYRNFSKR